MQEKEEGVIPYSATPRENGHPCCLTGHLSTEQCVVTVLPRQGQYFHPWFSTGPLYNCSVASPTPLWSGTGIVPIFICHGKTAALSLQLLCCVNILGCSGDNSLKVDLLSQGVGAFHKYFKSAFRMFV